MGWGTFFGSAAKTGLDTYERLGEEELRELQRKEIKRQIAEREALDTNYKNTIGKQGTVTDYIGAVQQGTGVGVEQAEALKAQLGDVDPQFATADAEAVRGGALRTAPPPGKDASGQPLPTPTAAIPEKFKYTQEQAIRDYQKGAAGISREGALQALQTGQVIREEANIQKFVDEKANLLTKVTNLTDSADIPGLTKLLKEYNLELISKTHGSNVTTYSIKDSKTGEFVQKDVPFGRLGGLAQEAVMNSYFEGAMDKFSITPTQAKDLFFQKFNARLNARRVAALEKEAEGKYKWYTRPTGQGQGQQARIVSITTKDTETGKDMKVPVTVVTTIGANGVPVVKAFTLDGKPVTDNQAVTKALMGETGENAGYLSVVNSLNKALESGTISYKQYKEEMTQVRKDFGMTATHEAMKNLPEGDTIGRPGSDKKELEQEKPKKEEPKTPAALPEGINRTTAQGRIAYEYDGKKYKTRPEAERAQADKKLTAAGVQVLKKQGPASSDLYVYKGRIYTKPEEALKAAEGQ